MKKQNSPVIGFVLKGYPRISETFISNEILLLEKSGFKLHIFSMRNPRENFCHDSVKQIKAGVDYLPQYITGNVGLLFGSNLKQAVKSPKNYLQSLAVAWRRYRRTRKVATFRHLLQAGYLVNRLLPGKDITHLHAHFAHSPTSVTMFASLISGLPYSFTGHAKDIYTSDPRQLKEKIDLAKFVVTCTDYNKRYLSDLAGDDASKIHRVYHGIDLGLFSGKNGDRNPEPPFRLMTVARLTPKKGLITVLKAIRIMLDQGLRIEHQLIGDGDDRDLILAAIKELGLEETTSWLGTKPHHEVIKRYQWADLFLLGCQIVPNGDRDGIPNVLVESMAMGVPVLATNISAIPELVVDGETGVLVPPEQPEVMARAATRLLTDLEFRQKITVAAAEKVRDHFDNQALIGELAEIYARYLG